KQRLERRPAVDVDCGTALVIRDEVRVREVARMHAALDEHAPTLDERWGRRHPMPPPRAPPRPLPAFPGSVTGSAPRASRPEPRKPPGEGATASGTRYSNLPSSEVSSGVEPAFASWPIVELFCWL